ncbi:allantoinase PuuE [Thalassobaculum sp.]|uniref:allantoinase PuuE n=1 Tax=Thalassobaculum sp. TaxID=2022740 RepID=UPI003B5A598D
MSAYPRDLIGYGAEPPHAQWPGGARVALNFVLNVEEGSETNILHGDAKNESGLSEVVGGRHPPGQRDLGLESLYDYGPRAGFWRIHRLFAERNLPLTVYACAMALERNPVATEAMAKAGWDFAGHGWRWINHYELTEDEEREHIARAIEITERLTGQRLKGWYCRYAPSPNTRRLLVEQGGFLYDSDSYSDDLPYWVKVEGADHLVIPYALDTNDVKFGAPASYSSGEDFFRYITDAYDQLWDEGADRPRMLSIGLHQRLVGRPGRARALAKFLDHVQAKGSTWITRRIEIAEHWRRVHPPA